MWLQITNHDIEVIWDKLKNYLTLNNLISLNLIN